MAAVECSDSANTDLCRSYEVKGYPTIKVRVITLHLDFAGLFVFELWILLKLNTFTSLKPTWDSPHLFCLMATSA